MPAADVGRMTVRDFQMPQQLTVAAAWQATLGFAVYNRRIDNRLRLGEIDTGREHGVELVGEFLSVEDASFASTTPDLLLVIDFDANKGGITIE